MDLSKIFKAYDIRGVYPEEIDETKVKRIAMAYAKFTGAKTVAVGRDVRLSGPKLQKAVIDGLTEAGVNVEDIGPVPTDMLYFAVGFYHYDGGIQVSASHNPAQFNGLKMVRRGVEAISSDNGLQEIRALAQSDENLASSTKGSFDSKEIEEDYFDYLTKFVHFDTAEPLKIVANNNFGLSGEVAQRFLTRIHNAHIQLIELNFQPDGNFPKGRPDPLQESNRRETSELILETKADFGVAWDADGDRCYISDEKGEAIEGCHLTALLAVHLLHDNKGEKILYDPRNIWAVKESVAAAGGISLLNKAGHTFIKNRMRQEDALFAGEMSGHFYFRNFYYADNGLIPFLLFLNIVAETKKPVSEIIKPLRDKYYVSGEINFEVADKGAMTKKIEEKYAAGSIDRTDGLSISFDNWRFNLRASNTENLLRLNVEAKDKTTCDQETQELKALIS
ncbi:MAG: phosphomannomutase/phosphoglucomutase [Candidatus Berkelbacteria bacterium]|nr:phosphomannomutase/phosphoglucomutase [Candidatus Berkelbacteria bacterium]